MELIFKLKDNLLKSYSLDELIYDKDIQLIFGPLGVKEISFVNNIYEEWQKDIIKDFYEKINNEIFFVDVEEIILKFSEEVFYHYKTKVKGFMYRMMGYVRNKQYIPQEHFSIRFEEDDYYEVDFKNNLILCGKEKCSYYDSKKYKCKKYKQEIPQNKIICKSCFLEAHTSIINKFINPLYANMERIINIDN